jgi:hypothetical protein
MPQKNSNLPAEGALHAPEPAKAKSQAPCPLRFWTKLPKRTEEKDSKLLKGLVRITFHQLVKGNSNGDELVLDSSVSPRGIRLSASNDGEVVDVGSCHRGACPKNRRNPLVLQNQGIRERG